MTETIELDREQLGRFFHQRCIAIQDFYPPEDFAEETAHPDVGTYEEELEYARGNLIADSETLSDAELMLGVEPEELAREYAERHGYDTFENPPFSEDDE